MHSNQINPQEIANNLSTNPVQRDHIANALMLLHNLDGDDLYDHANLLAALKKLTNWVEKAFDAEVRDEYPVDRVAWEAIKEEAMNDYLKS